MQTAVRRQAANRFLDALEVPGFNGQFINEHRRQQRPGDADDAEDEATRHRAGNHVPRHAENQPGDEHRSQEAINSGTVRVRLLDGEQVEQYHHRDRRNHRREPDVRNRIIILNPLIHREL